MAVVFVDRFCTVIGYILIALFAIIITKCYSETIDPERVTYTFSEFQYKETSKNVVFQNDQNSYIIGNKYFYHFRN